MVLLLEEPTWDLDPLNTYFIISILSNHAKKYNRIVMITMEKPRSDIFPFLDRVTYLCLGDVVYTGATRMMLDYFRSIGFPCPELENPLMYYLCLSTVDRRSRERFIESNNQISALVEKFKVEGGPYRKYAGPAVELEHMEQHQKIPLTAYGRPGFLTVFSQLVSRDCVIIAIILTSSRSRGPGPRVTSCAWTDSRQHSSNCCFCHASSSYSGSSMWTLSSKFTLFRAVGLI